MLRDAPPPPLKAGLLPCLLALAFLPLTGAEADATRRSDAFEPKPTPQPQVEKKQIEVGESRPAAEEKMEFVTVPAVDAKARLPAIREKEKAPIEVAARPFPVHHPESAPISTDRAAPGKFDRKFATPAAIRIQDGMAEAGRGKKAAFKTNAKPSVLGRINRFVFRRNEPAPATTPAGGENGPTEGSKPPAGSTGS